MKIVEKRNFYERLVAELSRIMEELYCGPSSDQTLEGFCLRLKESLVIYVRTWDQYVELKHFVYWVCSKEDNLELLELSLKYFSIRKDLYFKLHDQVGRSVVEDCYGDASFFKRLIVASIYGNGGVIDRAGNFVFESFRDFEILEKHKLNSLLYAHEKGDITDQGLRRRIKVKNGIFSYDEPEVLVCSLPEMLSVRYCDFSGALDLSCFQEKPGTPELSYVLAHMESSKFLSKFNLINQPKILIHHKIENPTKVSDISIYYFDTGNTFLGEHDDLAKNDTMFFGDGMVGAALKVCILHISNTLGSVTYDDFTEEMSRFGLVRKTEFWKERLRHVHSKVLGEVFGVKFKPRSSKNTLRVRVACAVNCPVFVTSNFRFPF